MNAVGELSPDHQDLLQFLYAVPTGLVHAGMDGRIDLINSAAARWMLALSPSSDLANFYDTLSRVVPDLEHRVHETAQRRGVGVCLTRRLVVEPPPRSRDPRQVIALTVSKLSQDRLMVSFEDITQQVQYEQDLRDTQAHYEAVVSVLSEGVVVHAAGGRLLTSNAAAERIIGLPVSACAGLLPIPPGWQAFRPDGTPLAETDSPAARVLAGDGPQVGMTLRIEGPLGEVRWLELSAQPVRTPDAAAVLASVTSFSDTTQRERMQAELHHHREQLEVLVKQRTRQLQVTNTELAHQQRRLRTVADAVPGLISSWGSDLRARFANSAYEGWYGRARGDMEGLGLAELLGPAAFEAQRPHMEAVLRGQAQHFQGTVSKADGSTAHTLTTYIPEWVDGQVQGFHAVVTDVTMLKQAEIQLTLLNEQLEERARQADEAGNAKSAFLANMSHEIRTPMNAIIGLTHLMLRDAQEALLRDRLGKVDHAARHLLQLINDVLDLSKIGAGKMVLHEAEFAVDETLLRCVEMVLPTLRGQPVELVMDALALPARLRGDAGRLSQALINLLSNAVKFTQEGWIRLRAEVVEEEPERLHVRFEVQDTGPGVEPDRQAVLFNAFEQADNSATRQHGGTGLGLALTRHIAELMGGSSGVDSWPGVGSTFWFSAWLGRTPVVAAPPAPHAGRRALVVDDLAVSLRALDEGLRLLGLDVDALTDGRMALQWLEREWRSGRGYDVVLVDGGMEPLDGEATLRRMREQLGPAMPPSILLVPREGTPPVQPALASTLLYKPFAGAGLRDALQRALQPLPHPAAEERPREDRIEIDLRRHAGQRVLLVEDNRVNQEVAVELLRGVGLVVDTADHGLQAVERVLAEPYDLVLMDVQMPHMDGLAATRAIRRQLGRPVPILALTANAFSEERAACLDAGMNDHVVKPVDPQLLFAALERWLPRPGAQQAAEPPLAHAPLAPAGSAESQLLSARLAAVPGLDAAWALRNTGGRADILHKVLATFVERYRDGKPGLRIAAGSPGVSAAEHRAALRAACHSLRGSCGAIGALGLKLQIEALERLLDQPVPVEAWQREALALDESLRALTADLAMALG